MILYTSIVAATIQPCYLHDKYTRHGTPGTVITFDNVLCSGYQTAQKIYKEEKIAANLQKICSSCIITLEIIQHTASVFS